MKYVSSTRTRTPLTTCWYSGTSTCKYAVKYFSFPYSYLTGTVATGTVRASIMMRGLCALLAQRFCNGTPVRYSRRFSGVCAVPRTRTNSGKDSQQAT
eukprot:scaffold588849_cov25-Prasinocladus_malaysianus.AAC.1